MAQGGFTFSFPEGCAFSGLLATGATAAAPAAWDPLASTPGGEELFFAFASGLHPAGDEDAAAWPWGAAGLADDDELAEDDEEHDDRVGLPSVGLAGPPSEEPPDL